MYDPSMSLEKLIQEKLTPVHKFYSGIIAGVDITFMLCLGVSVYFVVTFLNFTSSAFSSWDILVLGIITSVILISCLTLLLTLMIGLFPPIRRRLLLPETKTFKKGIYAVFFCWALAFAIPMLASGALMFFAQYDIGAIGYWIGTTIGLIAYFKIFLKRGDMSIILGEISNFMRKIS
ncbi:hypothetical protein [Methanorbis furvi]|uniref:hypothetical protein n=1 Tax=Methanorbis furvi TaxID=3028299 RepID=UPI0030B8D8E9